MEIKVIVIAIAALTVLATLILGAINFGREGEEARRRSNRLMQWRVGLQLLALIVILAAVMA